MSIWLFRAGKNGEFENKFLSDKRIYLTWNDLRLDLSKYGDRSNLLKRLQELYSGEKTNTIRNWASQIYPIAHRMKKAIGLFCQVRYQVQFILVRLLGNMFMMQTLKIHTITIEMWSGLLWIFRVITSTKIYCIPLARS